MAYTEHTDPNVELQNISGYAQNSTICNSKARTFMVLLQIFSSAQSYKSLLSGDVFGLGITSG